MPKAFQFRVSTDPREEPFVLLPLFAFIALTDASSSIRKISSISDFCKHIAF